MYVGGAAAIGARLAGSDVIYIAAPVDRTTLTLLGERGIKSFKDLRGKSIATTSPGAFGDVALHKTGTQYGMEAGKDFSILYNQSVPAALAELKTGKVSAAILTPPESLQAEQAGYPVVIDFHKAGLKMIGPGMAVNRAYYKDHKATLTAFIEGYLDGIKRASQDPQYAQKIDSQWTGQSADVGKLDYDYSKPVWNTNLTVDPASITIYLQNPPYSERLSGKHVDVSEFYDNGLIKQINGSYGH